MKKICPFKILKKIDSICKLNFPKKMVILLTFKVVDPYKNQEGVSDEDLVVGW